jgi:uncharacterized membrane protein YkoI
MGHWASSGYTGEEDQMRNRTKALIAAAVVSTIGIGTGVAIATGGDDAERPITGSALDKAKAAALDHVGEGRVTETEVGDEESYYEVEVTKDDGSQVDVQLDEDFNVVGSDEDEEKAGEDDDAGSREDS